MKTRRKKSTYPQYAHPPVQSNQASKTHACTCTIRFSHPIAIAVRQHKRSAPHLAPTLGLVTLMVPCAVSIATHLQHRVMGCGRSRDWRRRLRGVLDTSCQSSSTHSNAKPHETHMTRPSATSSLFSGRQRTATRTLRLRSGAAACVTHGISESA